MQYDIIPKPPRGRSADAEYYIVPVYEQTINEEQIASSIERAYSLTRGDLLASVSAITDEMARMLQSGHKVKISGLGTFRLRIKTPKKDLKVDDKVAKHIEVRDVAFSPDRNFIRQFANMSFTRTDHSRTLHHVTESDELLTKLHTHFASNEFLRSTHVEALAHCSRSTACKFLRTFTEEGYIVNVGTHRNPIYRATAMLNGKD